MEFSGQYLTYEEYVRLGGTLNQTPFNLLELESRNQINLRTQNRLESAQEIPEKVKLCVFHLINKLDSYAKASAKSTENGAIASESTDGYSVSYIDATKLAEILNSQNSELDDIMMTDLFGVVVNGVAILYNGVI